MDTPNDIAAIEAAMLKVAQLLDHDASFAPIFERLELEREAALAARKDRTAIQERAAAFMRSYSANSPSSPAV